MGRQPAVINWLAHTLRELQNEVHDLKKQLRQQHYAVPDKAMTPTPDDAKKLLIVDGRVAKVAADAAVPEPDDTKLVQDKRVVENSEAKVADETTALSASVSEEATKKTDMRLEESSGVIAADIAAVLQADTAQVVGERRRRTLCLDELVPQVKVGKPVGEETIPETDEKVKEVSHEREQLNKNKPLWMRKSEDVTSEECASLYKSLSNDWEDHLSVKHFSIERQLEPRVSFDLFQSKQKKNNVKLYVRGVIVMDDCDVLMPDMPDWLNFVKGVVDSEDLPLSISRETLQQNKTFSAIKDNLANKCLEMLAEITVKKGDYKTCYEQFGKFLKLGMHTDPANRTKLDPVDEYAIQQLGKSDDRKLKSATQEGLDIEDEDEGTKDYVPRRVGDQKVDETVLQEHVQKINQELRDNLTGLRRDLQTEFSTEVQALLVPLTTRVEILESGLLEAREKIQAVTLETEKTNSQVFMNALRDYGVPGRQDMKALMDKIVDMEVQTHQPAVDAGDLDAIWHSIYEMQEVQARLVRLTMTQSNW